MKPRVFFLGISEGTKPHVSAKRVWSSDYELVEKEHYDLAISTLRNSPCISRFGEGAPFVHDDMRCDKCKTLKELGEI